MKKLFTLFLGLWMINAVFAECITGISVYPENSQVAQNSLFMVEGNVMDDVIKNLGKNYAVYLQSKEEKIPLVKVKYNKGNGFEQMILKPQKQMKEGEVYSLYVEGLPTYLIPRDQRDTKVAKLKTFYTLAPDTQAPVLQTQPKLLAYEFRQLGCGDDVYAIFSNSAKDDDSEIWVKTTVKNLDTGEVMQYYIKPFNGKLYVGHGMCSGAFNFGDSKQFSVVFSFMDSSGNVSDANIEPVIFENPIYHKKSK
ncbi:hypothetical protein [Ornithobacterium rhinotracheale]